MVRVFLRGGAKRGERGKKLSADEKASQIEALRAEMKKAAAELRFEEAAYLRDKIKVMEQTK